MQDQGTAEGWSALYRLAAIAAIVVVVMIPIQSVLFIAAPPPTTVLGFLELFQRNPMLGLLDLDLLLTFDNLAMILVYVALYGALRRTNEGPALTALVVGIMSVTLFVVSREATFSMWALSSQYASASAGSARAALLASGQTLLTVYNGSCFDVSYVLGGVAILVNSLLMLRCTVFSVVTARVGLAMAVLMLVPPTVGAVGLVLAFLSLIPTAAWLVLVSRRLLNPRLGIPGGAEHRLAH